MNLSVLNLAYEATKTKFKKCKTSLERVNFVLKRQIQVGCEFTLTQNHLKSNKKSLNMRDSGNAFFKNGDYWDALECYTVTIALAESGKFISLGYANRSAVLARLGFYSECLTDIERALESDYPEELKFKLIARREKVVKLIKPVNLVQDSIEPGGCFQVQENEKYGRHIVATKDIEIGEVILVEKPIGLLIKKDCTLYCHECLALCYNPIPCTNCSKLLYCSEKCQEAAFDAYHKYECPIWEAIASEFVISVKITVAALVEKHTTGDFGRYRHIFSLQTHEDDVRTRKELFSTSFATAFIFRLFKNKTNFFTEIKDAEDSFKELLYRTFLIGQVNGVNISRLDFGESADDIVCYAIALYHEYSFFNHSCCPNAFFYHDGPTIIVRAQSTIKKGEQCFISYGSTYWIEKTKRQQVLLKYFGFNCTCQACKEDWQKEESSEEVSNSFKYVKQAQLRLDYGCLRIFATCFIRKLKELEPHAPVKNFKCLQVLLQKCLLVNQTIRKSNESTTKNN